LYQKSLRVLSTDPETVLGALTLNDMATFAESLRI